jgi:ribosome biogenesis GTPase A
VAATRARKKRRRQQPSGSTCMLMRLCYAFFRRQVQSHRFDARLFSAAATVSCCPGCGCVVQYSDPAAPGFAPAGRFCVCERCFRIRNYGARHVRSTFASDGKVLDGTDAVGSFVDNVRQGSVPLRALLIIDPLDFTRRMWLEALESTHALKCVEVDVCVTKMDLLPPDVDADKVMASVTATLGLHGQHSVFAVSSTTQNGVKQVVNHVHHVLSAGISILLVGFANAGKSSLANVLAGKLRRMLVPLDSAAAATAVLAADNQQCMSDGVEFTVSKLPGTTVEVVSTPLPNYQDSASGSMAQLYDSPGLVSGFSYSALGSRLCRKDILADRMCMSAKRKLRSFSVKNGQCMVIGRLCALKVCCI